MSEDSGSGEGTGQAEAGALARDWITIWQSELAALATDREARETWQKLVALWAEAALSVVGAAPLVPAPRRERDGRFAGSADAARPASAAAASGDRDGEIERLRARLDALEQRLGEMERERGGDGGNSAQGRRPRRGKGAP